MDTASMARWRLGVITAALPLLVLGAVVGGRLMAAPSANDGSSDEHPAATQASPVAPQPTSSTTSGTEPTAWTRPTTTDPSSFVRAFALAVWTYDTEQPYDVWKEAIGEWANPLGDPASASVGQSMLPPPKAYERLRDQGARGTAEITSVTVPDVAASLAARAPEGWHAFTVRGTQHISAAGREVDTDRQLTVAVVCVRTCWLWSVTPEVEQ